MTKATRSFDSSWLSFLPTTPNLTLIESLPSNTRALLLLEKERVKLDRTSNPLPPFLPTIRLLLPSIYPTLFTFLVDYPVSQFNSTLFDTSLLSLVRRCLRKKEPRRAITHFENLQPHSKGSLLLQRVVNNEIQLRVKHFRITGTNLEEEEAVQTRTNDY